MKTIKPILAIAITILVASCKKSDTPPTPQKTILQIVNYSSVGTYTYTYDNANNFLKESYGGNASNPSSAATIKNYDAKGRVSNYLVEYSSSPTSNYKVVVSYDDNGKIERKQLYDVSGNNAGYVYFQYSPLKTTVKRYSASNAIQQTEEYTFSADSANVITYKSFNAAGTLLSTTDYSNFDTKKSVDALYPYGYYDYPANKNNWQTLSRKNNATGAITGFTATFDYNEDGYPLKRTGSTGADITYAYLKK